MVTVLTSCCCCECVCVAVGMLAGDHPGNHARHMRGPRAGMACTYRVGVRRQEFTFGSRRGEGKRTFTRGGAHMLGRSIICFVARKQKVLPRGATPLPEPYINSSLSDAHQHW